MSKVTLTQAAKMAGITKQAIRKAINSGKLTSEKNEQGHILVQAGDVQRVWPRRTVVETDFERLSLVTSELQPSLQAKLEVSEAENRMLRERLRDLETDRDHWRENANRAQTLLTDTTKQAEKSTQKLAEQPLTIWQWLGLQKR